ncbi:uncharacterized protein LOC143251292 [Tachypleus tridentatus]|uniref:uncharacterized protein LOC143251292 n=1 Tax=Tachypleus tridentatus TaxID=6853 RepID=UPI003FD6B8DC
MFESNPLSTLRLIHYPPRPLQHTPKSATDGNLVLLCDKHGDAGFFTFLTTFHYHGLQMQDSDNNWINIPPVKNALIVNIGLNMAKLTAGRFKPTIHRVIDLGISRYSVPFFLEPHFDADMSNSLFGTPLEGTAKNLKYGMWLKNNSAQYAENAHTDWGVPEELVSDYQTNSHVNDEL